MPKRGANSVVLDASALLALIRQEPGMEVVARHVADAVIGSVNYSEVLKKSIEYGGRLDEMRSLLADLQLDIIPFNTALAEEAAALWPTTRELGLSLADRCCLALANLTGMPVLTADRNWEKVKTGVKVRVIR